MALRGAVSSNFRAPSLAQENFSFTVTDFGTGGALAVQGEPQDLALNAWQTALARVGMRLNLHADLAPIQWGKLLLNLNNPVNALSGLPLRDELLQRGYRRILAALQQEALDLLDAAGLPVAQVKIRAADGRDLSWHDLAWKRRDELGKAGVDCCETADLP